MGYIYAICYNNIPIYIKTVKERWRKHLNLAKRQQGYKIHEFRWSLNKSIQLSPLQANYTGSFKQIGQYDLDEKLLHIFNSTKEAARFLNKSQGIISSAANGKRKTTLIISGHL